MAELIVAGLVISGFTLITMQHATEASDEELALQAIQPIDPQFVSQGQALETLATLHQGKQNLHSNRSRDSKAFTTAIPEGVRLLVIEHDPVKRETRVVGERSSRAALQQYLVALGPNFPEISLAPSDWAATESALFHLTVKRP